MTPCALVAPTFRRNILPTCSRSSELRSPFLIQGSDCELLSSMIRFSSLFFSVTFHFPNLRNSLKTWRRTQKCFYETTSKFLCLISRGSQYLNFNTPNGELERIWKEAIVAESKSYSGICLHGLGKTTKKLRQVSRSVIAPHDHPSLTNSEGCNIRQTRGLLAK
jgi:hypothetical protein